MLMLMLMLKMLSCQNIYPDFPQFYQIFKMTCENSDKCLQNINMFHAVVKELFPHTIF